VVHRPPPSPTWLSSGSRRSRRSSSTRAPEEGVYAYVDATNREPKTLHLDEDCRPDPGDHLA
jgi:hypothetical protein